MTKSKLFLFVVETNETCLSDEYYITYFIKKSGFFQTSSWTETALQFVYLDGKTNYNAEKVKKEILRIWQAYGAKNKHLFYVFDYDRDTRKDKNLNQKITDYCKSFQIPNEIIWFKKDIENNFLGESVKSKDKQDRAISFYTRGTLDKTKEKILSLTKHTTFKSNPESNVLSVLSNHLETTTSFSRIIQDCIQENKDEENRARNQKISKKKLALAGRNKGKK